MVPPFRPFPFTLAGGDPAGVVGVAKRARGSSAIRRDGVDPRCWIRPTARIASASAPTEAHMATEGSRNAAPPTAPHATGSGANPDAGTTELRVRSATIATPTPRIETPSATAAVASCRLRVFRARRPTSRSSAGPPLSHRERAPPAPPPPPAPAADPVQRAPVQVPGWTIHVADPVPALPQVQEGVLGDLLGLAGITRHEAERAEQRRPLLLEELLEGRGRLRRHECRLRHRPFLPDDQCGRGRGPVHAP